MCQYRQHGSHYVSHVESLSWKIQIQKGHTANGGVGVGGAGTHSYSLNEHQYGLDHPRI